MPKKETSNYSIGYQAYLMPYNKLTNEQRAKVPYINIERGGQPNSDMSNVLVYTDTVNKVGNTVDKSIPALFFWQNQER